MTFADAIQHCFNHYADFDGRADRSEFGWFALFVVLGTVACARLPDTVGELFLIGVLLPTLAAGTRRLRDTGRSGWWLLLLGVPIVGWVAVAWLLAAEPRIVDLPPSIDPS